MDSNTNAVKDNQIKRYIFDGTVIGEGGMGIVYRATDRLTDQIVAFKQVRIAVQSLNFTTRPALTDEEMQVLTALSREFQMLATVRHPHIIAVMDYGFDAKHQPFFTMEFVQGAKTFVEAGEDLRLTERADLLIQLLQALDYLHRRNIVHRDLKPENALVNNDGRVMVLDFGLAIAPEELKDGEIAGTMAYIAPETLQGSGVSTASDLYAVGMMAYEMFTGQHPFDTSNVYHLIQDIMSSEPDFDILHDAISDSFYAETKAPTSLDAATVVDIEAASMDTQPTPPPTAIMDNDLETAILDDGDIETRQTVVGQVDHFRHNVAETKPVDAERTEFVDREDVDEALNSAAQPARPTSRLQDALIHPEAYTAGGEPALAAVIRRLLEKDPEDRYSTPYAVIQDICEALNRPVPPEDVVIRESFLQAASFVGREAELEMLKNAIPTRATDAHNAWLIGGESGVGKSRLIQEFITQARIEGAIVFQGHAIGDGSMPYQIWQEPLRQLALTINFDPKDAAILKNVVPDLDQFFDRKVETAQSLEGAAERQRLNTTIARVFGQFDEPAILVLEDIHWAQDDLEPLKLILDQAISKPFMVVTSFRDNEYPDLPDRFPYLHRVSLERLETQEVAQLSVSILGDAGQDDALIAFLERETEGNVFFIVEIVRVLAEHAGRLTQIEGSSLPQQITAEGIRTVLDQHLSHLHADALPGLRTAAAFGRFLDLKIIEAVHDSASLETWLTTCANVALIERQDNRWRFVHDRMRIHILDQLEQAERQTIHQHVAEAIEKTYPDDMAQADALAYHYRLANNTAKEAHYARVSGEQRYNIGDFVGAQERLQRALEIAPDDEHRRKALKLLGDARHGQGEYDQALEDFQNSLVLAEAANDLHSKAAVLNSIGRTLSVRRYFDKAQEQFESALTIAQEVNDSKQIAMALFNKGNIAFLNHDYDTANSLYEQSLALFQQLHDQSYIGRALANLGMIAHSKDKLDVATELYDRAMKIELQTGNRQAQAVLLQTLAVLAEDQDDAIKAESYWEESLHLCREIHNRFHLYRSLEALGILAYQQDDFHLSEQYLSEAVTIRHELGDRAVSFVNTMNRLSLTHLRLGQLSQAQQQLQSAINFLVKLDDEHGWEVLRYVLLIFVQIRLLEDKPAEGAIFAGYLAQQVQETDLTIADMSQANLQQQLEAALTNDEFTAALTKGQDMNRDDIVALCLAT